MGITNKKPPLKETVGAQYYDFCKDENGDATVYTGEYEGNVTRTDTVVSVSVDENTSTTDLYASGQVYSSFNQKPKHSIEVEEVAVVQKDLARMRGDIVSDLGTVTSVENPVSPFFAYGKVVKFRDGSRRFDWYPKCQLTENTDEAETSEEDFSEQNETITITAYPYDTDLGAIRYSYDDQMEGTAEVSEEVFFSQVLTCDDDLEKAIASASKDEKGN